MLEVHPQELLNLYFLVLGQWGSKYLIIASLGIFLTFLLYLLLKNYIDKNNIKIWQTILLAQVF